MKTIKQMWDTFMNGVKPLDFEKASKEAKQKIKEARAEMMKTRKKMHPKKQRKMRSFPWRRKSKASKRQK